MASCRCCGLAIVSNPLSGTFSTRKIPSIGVWSIRRRPDISRVSVTRASMVDSSANFARRTEQAWLISQQPRPIACSSCNASGHVECKWCGGTGFFILGDNMLCEVASKNTSCRICSGQGSMCCADCKGTGFRAKWLGSSPSSKQ